MTKFKLIALPDGKSWSVFHDDATYIGVNLDDLDALTPAAIGRLVLHLRQEAERCRAEETAAYIMYLLEEASLETVQRLEGWLAPFIDNPDIDDAYLLVLEHKATLQGRTLKKVRVPKAGYVYILVEPKQRWYKIGRTTNVENRIKGIELPFKTEVLHTIPTSDTVWAEAYLHKKFAEKRLNGEWFKLLSRDVAWLQKLTILNPDAPPR